MTSPPSDRRRTIGGGLFRVGVRIGVRRPPPPISMDCETDSLLSRETCRDKPPIPVMAVVDLGLNCPPKLPPNNPPGPDEDADLVLKDGDGLSRLEPLSNLPLVIPPNPVVGVWMGVLLAVADRTVAADDEGIPPPPPNRVVLLPVVGPGPVGVPARDMALEKRDEIVDDADGVAAPEWTEEE